MAFAGRGNSLCIYILRGPECSKRPWPYPRPRRLFVRLTELPVESFRKLKMVLWNNFNFLRHTDLPSLLKSQVIRKIGVPHKSSVFFHVSQFSNCRYQKVLFVINTKVNWNQWILTFLHDLEKFGRSFYKILVLIFLHLSSKACVVVKNFSLEIALKRNVHWNDATICFCKLKKDIVFSKILLKYQLNTSLSATKAG